MAGQECIQIDICNAVAIGDHEGRVANVLADSLDATTGHSILAGVDEGNLPSTLAVSIVDVDLARSEYYGEVAIAHFVIQKIISNLIALVAEADNEFGVTLRGIELHYVPQDRAVTNLDHRFGAILSLLAEPSSQ